MLFTVCGLEYISNKFDTVMLMSYACTCILQALVQEDPNYVVKRYESRKYAIDESVTSEYLKVGCLGLMSTKKSEDIFYLSYTYMYVCIFTLFPLQVHVHCMLCAKVAAAMLNIPRHLNKRIVVVVFVLSIVFWY